MNLRNKIIGGVMDSTFFKMAFEFKPKSEEGVAEWGESGIRRYIAVWFIAAFAAFYLVAGFPGVRYYTILLFILFSGYYKLADVVPKILDELPEFDVQFNKPVEETERFQKILEVAQDDMEKYREE